jgi:hypothetical protein
MNNASKGLRFTNPILIVAEYLTNSAASETRRSNFLRIEPLLRERILHAGSPKSLSGSRRGRRARVHFFPPKRAPAQLE